MWMAGTNLGKIVGFALIGRSALIFDQLRPCSAGSADRVWLVNAVDKLL